MAISNPDRRWQRKPLRLRRRGCYLLLWLSMLLPLLAALSACAPTRPIAKIGLLAPFEGLYRRSGYAALDAMRTALAESAQQPNAILPLALDTSVDPGRAAQKLLIDPRVNVVVGPLDPPTAAAAAVALHEKDVRWIVPFAVTPSGFGALNDVGWVQGLTSAVTQAAQARGQMRLVLAGWTAGWPAVNAAAWRDSSALPVATSATGDAKAAIAPGDAIFWLGSAEAGADFYCSIPAALRRSSSFWLGPQAIDRVFVEIASATCPVEWDRLFWAIWLDSGYNGWASEHGQSLPSDYLIYKATQQAIAAINAIPQNQERSWSVQLFQVHVSDDAVEWRLVKP